MTVQDHAVCRKCGAALQTNAKALTRKYFGTAVEEFYCIDCLAEILGVTAEALYSKTKYFKSIGCTLFE